MSTRFDQCDETCTPDCGHCKGQPVAAMRAEVAACWDEIRLQRQMRSTALAEVAALTAERDGLRNALHDATADLADQAEARADASGQLTAARRSIEDLRTRMLATGAGDARKLSRLLFEARDAAEMYADVVAAQTDRGAPYLRRLVAEIDAYRSERGWNPDGFGSEDDHAPR